MNCKWFGVNPLTLYGVIFVVMLIGMLISAIVAGTGSDGVNDELQRVIFEGETDQNNFVNWEDYSTTDSIGNEIVVRAIDNETLTNLEIQTLEHDTWLTKVEHVAGNTETDMGAEVLEELKNNNTDFDFDHAFDENNNGDKILEKDQRVNLQQYDADRQTTRDALAEIADREGAGNKGAAIATGTLGGLAAIAGGLFGYTAINKTTKTEDNKEAKKSRWDKYGGFSIHFFFIMTFAVILGSVGAANGDMNTIIFGIVFMGLTLAPVGWQVYKLCNLPVSEDANIAKQDAASITDPSLELDRRRLVTLQKILQTMK